MRVRILLLAIPELSWFSPRLVQDPGARRAGLAVVLSQQDRSVVRPVGATVSILRFCHFARLGLERRGKREDAITVRYVRAEIPFVESLDPHQRRGDERYPTVQPWANDDSVDGHRVAHRHVGDLARDLSGARPDLD